MREKRAGPKHAISVDHEAAAAIAVDVHGVRGIALQQRDACPLIQLVIRGSEPVPTPWGPEEGYSQGLGQEVRGRGPPAEEDAVVRDAVAGLTIADRLADSGERVALGTARETRTRRPWRNRAQCQRGRSGAQHSAATAPPAFRRAPRSPAAQLGSRPVPSVQERRVPRAAPVSASASRPPRAPADRPGEAGHLVVRSTSGHCLGPSRGLAAGSQPLHTALGARAGRPRTWPSPEHLARAWCQSPSP